MTALDGRPTEAFPGLRFVVWGKPATKGSMRHIGNGRMIEDHATAKPWREAVKAAAVAKMDALIVDGVPLFTTLDGPVEVSVLFTFAKPKTAPKRRRIWPITRSSGDVDKLVRNVFDALVDVGVLVDDSQVVRLIAEKVFIGDHPAALTLPGATIVTRPMPDEELF